MPRVFLARTLPPRPVFRSRSERGGFERLAACRLRIWRYLCLEEREEIALLLAQSIGLREIGRRLGRAASTISREVRRNAATRAGGFDYRATTAQWHAARSARRPKAAKLATNAALRQYVQDRLSSQVSRPDGSVIAGPQTAGRHPVQHRPIAPASSPVVVLGSGGGDGPSRRTERGRRSAGLLL